VSVVLEGYVRISDGLLNAILTGDFSAVQLRIILALHRMSYQARGPVTLSLEAIMRALVSPGGLVTVSQEGLRPWVHACQADSARPLASWLLGMWFGLSNPLEAERQPRTCPNRTRRIGVRALACRSENPCVRHLAIRIAIVGQIRHWERRRPFDGPSGGALRTGVPQRILIA
jgi:hypothetical protein